MASDLKLSASLNPGVTLIPTAKRSMDCQATIVYIKLGIMDRVRDLHVPSRLSKQRRDRSEAFPIEIINKNSKNILISTQYRPPSSKYMKETLKLFSTKPKQEVNQPILSIT